MSACPSAAEAARRLRDLCDRVRRLMPLRSDPERFHVDRDEVAKDLLKLAGEFDPDGRRRTSAPNAAASRRERSPRTAS